MCICRFQYTQLRGYILLDIIYLSFRYNSFFLKNTFPVMFVLNDNRAWKHHVCSNFK
uniref:Uncharacterized protein n=1 Tax=Arundo donax TaxID=35708 RepID=A0A0A9FHZ5_ARUDO